MDITDFSTDALKDQQILALADKVEPIFDPAFNWDLKLPDGKVEVVTRDGRSIERLGSEVPGTPERPMTWDEILKKFSDCAQASINPVPLDNIKRTQDFIKSVELRKGVIEIFEMVS
jgi:2-methylcitrate dehydratase PrpD